MASEELDGERVLYQTETGRVQRLDAVGSIVWTLFDGTATVAELAADLADGFGADPEIVLRDVVALVQALLADNMLVGGDEEQALPEHTAPASDEPSQPQFLVDPPSG